MDACVFYGQALKILDEMQTKALRMNVFKSMQAGRNMRGRLPNVITYSSLITACAKELRKRAHWRIDQVRLMR